MWCDRCDGKQANLPKSCPTETRRTTVWGTVIGQWYRQDGIQENYAFRDQTYGFVVGASHLFANNLHLTGGAGYSYSDLHWENNKGSSDTNALYVTPSIGYSQSNYFVSFLTQVAFNWNDVDRRIQYPGLTRVTNSNFVAYDLLLRLDGAYKFAINDSTGKDGPFLIVPEGRLSYLNVFQQSIDETGAGSLNLKVKSKTTAFLQPEILVKILKEYYTENSCIIPMIKVGYISKIPLSSATYTATLRVIDCPSNNMSVKSFDWNSNQLMLGAGLVFKTLDSFSAGMDYEAHLYDKSQVHQAKVKLDWTF